MPCIGKPAAARYTYAMHVNSRLSWLGRVRMKNKINIEKKPSSTKTNIPRCVSLVTPFLRFHPQFLPVDRSQSTVFTHGKYQLNGSKWNECERKSETAIYRKTKCIFEQHYMDFGRIVNSKYTHARNTLAGGIRTTRQANIYIYAANNRQFSEIKMYGCQEVLKQEIKNQ